MDKYNVRDGLIAVFEEILGKAVFTKYKDIEQIRLIDDLGLS